MCDHAHEIPAYDAQAIEEKWMKSWEEQNLFAVDTDSTKPKKYVLEMFPYPSGDLHMGHARNYTIGDAMARQARMRGYDVLHPIGFDAFGLPAENAAIKHNTQAAAWTYKNMDQALATMKRMGFSYDMDRLVKTCSPDYYRWGQWIFEKLWERGLVYRKKNPVNWCPKCETVLANEQVTEGRCWRCDSEVEKRDLEQWYIKITAYAQRLVDDLDDLDFIDRVKVQQKNWIGRSTGAEVDFGTTMGDTLTVYTTRPDTLFGATYMVISPEHPLIEKWADKLENLDAVRAYQQEAAHKSDFERTEMNKDKTGVRLQGVMGINPVNDTEIPIFISDYVLTSYGTGAIMAVPAHDTRDWEFAKKFDLPIIEVVAGGDVEKEAFTDCATGTMVNSDFLNGLTVKDAIPVITKWLEEKGIGEAKVNYKLRDWVFSRQRYWGEPIPMIWCDKCGWQPVPAMCRCRRANCLCACLW